MLLFRNRLAEGGEDAVGWYGWYAVRAADRDGPRTLVGNGGYFGPPSQGSVEIGYSIVPEWQGRGYATEIVGALLDNPRLAARPDARQVIAHARSDNPASIAVLRHSSFLECPGEEPELLRFARACRGEPTD